MSKSSVVDPDRPGQPHRDFADLLPVPRHLRQLPLNGGQQGLVAQPGAGLTQDRQRADVQRSRRVLELVEGGVRGGQPGHVASPLHLPVPSCFTDQYAAHTYRLSAPASGEHAKRNGCAIIVTLSAPLRQASVCGPSMCRRVQCRPARAHRRQAPWTGPRSRSPPSSTANRRPAMSGSAGHPRRPRCERVIPMCHRGIRRRPHQLCRCRCGKQRASPTPRCDGYWRSSTVAARSLS